MNINTEDYGITEYEQVEINKLLKRSNITFKNDLEEMWYLIDLVWDDFECDNKNLDWSRIEKFYSHPVWIINSLFAEQDKESIGHREAVVEWILDNNFRFVIDYGGGPGVLSRLLASQNSHIKINIYEPYPSNYGVNKILEFDNINYIAQLNSLKMYDCLVGMDVLEHVDNPLKILYKMINSVKTNGYLIIGAPFYPVIKCHLPRNFHFRYTFNIFASLMGLKVLGNIQGSPQTIYKKVKVKELNWRKIRVLEKFSTALFPFLEFARFTIWRAYKATRQIAKVK